MFSKKSLLVLSAFVAGSVILTSSCKKNDDISTATPAPTEVSEPTPVTESYIIIASDGHKIGINGKKDKSIARDQDNNVNGCGTASTLVIQAYSNISLSGSRLGCVLSNSWTGGGGQCIALYINGKPYKDGNSGYGLWSPATTAIACEYSQIEGGIVGSMVFSDFVRTYCNADTTGSPYFDSPLTSYVVPDGFVCNTPPPPKGKKK